MIEGLIIIGQDTESSYTRLTEILSSQKSKAYVVSFFTTAGRNVSENIVDKF